MKRIALSLIVLVAFAACSKNDDSTPSKENLILGKWQYSHYKEIEHRAIGDTTIEKDVVGEEYCEFKSGGLAIETYKENGQDRSDTMSYIIKGDSLIFDEGTAYRDAHKILNLTSKNMSLFQKYVHGVYSAEYWNDYVKK